jgi:carotenoid cleavage dioxygenase
MIDWDAIVQFDLLSGTRKTFQWPAGSIGGEPVYAPDPDRDGELDGWVLQLVQDRERKATDLCILDAAQVEAGPVARVHLPRTVPNGFHGSWLPSDRP